MVDAMVRRATAADLDTLVSLRAEMFAAMEVVETDGQWRRNARQWFADRLHNDAYHFAVVEVGGHVVACAVGAVRDAAPSPSVPEGCDVLVSGVCTSAKYRGRGHGRDAFDAVMDWARGLGVGRAELMATTDGHGMYRRAGFKETPMPAMRATLD